MAALSIALFLAVVNKTIVNYLIEPVRVRYPHVDLWWVVYVSLITGAALGWVAQINLFADYIPVVIAGRVLTAVLIGGGSSIIYDLFDYP